MRSDEELMAAYKEHDVAAFRELFQRYAPVLLRLLARDAPTSEAAKDLVQQTFLQLHRARFDFDTGRPFKPWLFTIALNLKREYFRTRRRHPESLAGDAQLERASSVSLHEQLGAQRSVNWALERLPDDQREVIELHWFDGLSFTEIAERLGIGLSAARVRAHRGYRQLRELLGDGVERKIGNVPGRGGI